MTEARPEGIDLALVQPAFQNEGVVDRAAFSPRDAEFPCERIDRMSIFRGVLKGDRNRLLLLNRSGQPHHFGGMILRTGIRRALVAAVEGAEDVLHFPAMSGD